MAAGVPKFSMLLFVFLLSLFTTKTVAHDRFLIPPSCTGHPSLLKCALGFKSALMAAASTETHITDSELSIALESINAAKATGISILHFLSSLHGGLINEHYSKIECVDKVNSTIDIAVHELIKASMVINDKTKFTRLELHNAKKCLKMASKIVAKLNVGVGLKHANNDTNMLLMSNLIKQFVNLTNLSLKVITRIEAHGKISL